MNLYKIVKRKESCILLGSDNEWHYNFESEKDRDLTFETIFCELKNQMNIGFLFINDDKINYECGDYNVFWSKEDVPLLKREYTLKELEDLEYNLQSPQN